MCKVAQALTLAEELGQADTAPGKGFATLAEALQSLANRILIAHGDRAQFRDRPAVLGEVSHWNQGSAPRSASRGIMRNRSTRTSPVTQGTRLLLAACLGLLSTVASALNLSDHWYDPNQPGWGLSVTHQADTIFAVLYVYSNTAVDQSGRGASEWYVMPAMRDPGFEISPVPPVQFRGTLYSGRGSPYNLAFNPAATQITPVGEASILPDTDGAGAQLPYRIGDTTVTKRIRRMSLARLPLTGTYAVTMSGSVNPSAAGASCSNAGTFLRNETWIIETIGSPPVHRITFASYDFSVNNRFDLQVTHAGSTVVASLRSPLGLVAGTWTLLLDHVGEGGWSGTARVASDTTITANIGGNVVTLPACVMTARITGTRTTNVSAF